MFKMMCLRHGDVSHCIKLVSKYTWEHEDFRYLGAIYTSDPATKLQRRFTQDESHRGSDRKGL